MGGLVLRLVALALAVIEASLVIRLVLPFVQRVPRGLHGLVPPLISFTDVLIAPFRGIIAPFDLSTMADVPGGAVEFLQRYLDRIDQAVVVAIIAWGLVGAITLFVLRLVIRAGR